MNTILVIFEVRSVPISAKLCELPQWIIENKEKFMDKKWSLTAQVGIRCEKFPGWLLREGFQDVAQPHGEFLHGNDPEVQARVVGR